LGGYTVPIFNQVHILDSDIWDDPNWEVFFGWVETTRGCGQAGIMLNLKIGSEIAGNTDLFKLFLRSPSIAHSS
jgi:hypothetical protein